MFVGSVLACRKERNIACGWWKYLLFVKEQGWRRSDVCVVRVMLRDEWFRKVSVGM